MKRAAVLLLLYLATFTAHSRAEEWPKGYVIHEGSVSPDKRFGILVPDIHSMAADENLGEINYLANLEKHVLLGKIDGARYWEHGNHVDLSVQWTPDSSVCVPTYEARFGFHSLSTLLIRRDGSAFQQLKMGDTIQAGLDRLVRQSSKNSVNGCEAMLFTRLDGDRVHVRALGGTNPKQMEDIATFNAYFHGTYDIKSGKWIEAVAQPLTEAQNSALEGVLLDQSDGFDSPESEADYLDQILNDVYQAARFVLPAERFAKVKRQQITWLKARDSIHDLPLKNRFVAARIDTLRQLIW